MPEEVQPQQTESTSPESFTFGSFMDDPKNVITEEAGFDETPEEPAQTAAEPAESTEESDETTNQEQPQETAGQVSFKGIRPEVVAILKHLAKADELDLADPKVFKMARQIAEKEAMIRDLKKQTPDPAAQNYLDAFNDPEPEPQQPKPGQEQVQDQGQQEALPPYVEKAKKWQSPKDFAKDLEQAYDIQDPEERSAAVADTMLGFLDRALMQNYLPQFRQMFENLQQQRLGPVMNQVQEAQEMQIRQSAVETLEKMEGFSDIRELFEPASDGEIELDGEKVADTWINRTLVAFPGILELHVQGKTPAETRKKTYARRYAEAHRLMKVLRQTQGDNQTQPKALINAGKAIEASKRDTVRTSLNAGKSGVPTGGRQGSVFGSGNSNEFSMREL